MSRFARITEEIMLRHKELAEKTNDKGETIPGKGALQTFYLYQLILLRSWATGVSDMTLPEICETYGLDLDNSYRRLKVLRTKGWIADSTKYIKPLLVHRAGDSKAVKNTVESENKTVKITANNCKNYSQSNEKAVKITVKNAATSDEISDSGDAKIFKDLKNSFITTTHGEKTAGVSVENNQNLSKFSLSECLEYVELCKASGDEIRNPRALAMTLHKSGAADVLIQAKLYPEPIPEQIIVYDAPDGEPSGKQLEALAILLDLQSSGEEIESQQQFYSADDWAWLMDEMKNYV